MKVFVLLLLSTTCAFGQVPAPTVALRFLPYDLPAGCGRAAYLTPTGDLKYIELTPNNPSLRIQVTAGPTLTLFEPPSAALTEQLKAKLVAEGRPNAPVRYTADVLTPMAQVSFQSTLPRALAILFPTGKDRPKLLGYAMSDDLENFRPGYRRLFNLTSRTIVGRLGKRTATLQPRSVMDIGPIAEGDTLTFVPITLGYMKDGALLPLTASRWAHDPTQRTVVFIYEDPADQRIRVQACSERTDLPELGDPSAGLAVGFGSQGAKGNKPAANSPVSRPVSTAPVKAPEGPRALTEAEAAEMKARREVDSTNFQLPSL